MNFDIPILLIVFNRPLTTRVVFEKIKKIKPAKLYIVSDGPRENMPDEKEMINQTRKIFEEIDWPCYVQRKYQDKNLGCGLNVSDGISWFFQNEEMGIILEDDCVPSISFFPFCKELLIKYENDSRIMHINGSRYNEERKRNDDSYFFSRYAHIWGWATWRRAWQLFDLNMNDWPKFRDEGWMVDLFTNRKERKFWNYRFDAIYKAGKSKHAWGYQWQYCVNKNNSLCITSQYNLVKNIGFEGVHTNSIQNNHNIEIVEDFIIHNHPTIFINNSWFDRYHFKHHFNIKRPILQRICNKIKRVILKPL
jgi:hypothetical protein